MGELWETRKSYQVEEKAGREYMFSACIWDTCGGLFPGTYGRMRIWNPYSRKAFTCHTGGCKPCILDAGQDVNISIHKVSRHLDWILRFVFTQKKFQKTSLRARVLWHAGRRKAVGSVPTVFTGMFTSSISTAPDSSTGSENLDLPQPELQLNSFRCPLQLKIVLPKRVWLDKWISLETQQ